MKQIIYIQVWNSEKAKTIGKAACWDDMEEAKLSVENPIEVAQSISNVAGCSVRMTYYKEGIKVGSLNGAYFVPNN